MPHVSKKKLQQAALQRLHNRFATCLTQLTTTRQADRFLAELLTDTERIMLGKRLAIVCLLSEGVSPYRIQQTLGVSVSTVLSMKQRWQDRQYESIEAVYRDHTQHQQFWDDLSKLLRLGMPSMGKHRWQWLDELEQKDR